MSFWDNLAQVGGNLMSATGIPGIKDLGQAWVNSDNYFLQQDARRQAMHREDTAARRRANDYRLAGINPSLAAGSVAESSAATHAAQGQTEKDGGATGGVMSLLKSLADISLTQAQKDLAESQRSKNVAETGGVELDNALKAATNPDRIKMVSKQLEGVDLDNRNKQLDLAVKQVGIDATKQSILESQVRTKLAGQQLTNAQQDYISKVIAITIQGYNRDVIAELVKNNVGTARSIGEWIRPFTSLIAAGSGIAGLAGE